MALMALFQKKPSCPPRNMPEAGWHRSMVTGGSAAPTGLGSIESTPRSVQGFQCWERLHLWLKNNSLCLYWEVEAQNGVIPG